MINIIYANKITDSMGQQITDNVLKETFKKAIDIQTKLVSDNKKLAYFFIDPLLNSFEAANHFYFRIFECETIDKINTYKSGAGPIQALADAKELIEGGLYDAVFIFGYEPLLTNKLIFGKEAITNAMNIFEDHSIIQCYNEIAHTLCKKLELSKEEFVNLCDELFNNYLKTYTHVSGSAVSSNRGRFLSEYNADLFKLTDCANPYIDFSGGIIVTSDTIANFLQTAKREIIALSGVKYSMVEGSPKKINEIVGKKEYIFPHLRNAFLQAQSQSKIDVVEEFKNGNLALEVYTCYPPVPIAFLLATGIVHNVSQIRELLEQYEITVTGGMNLARAPWNNPVLNGMIEMYQRLISGRCSYGLVHGNGGIGEVQGIALLEKKSFL